MDYVFLFYIFLSFVIASGGAFVLFSSGRTISALMYLIGAISIEIFFGLRWFKAGGATTAAVGPWPPSINVCPDFLSLYKTSDGSGNSISYCVDNNGIASAGGLTRWSAGSAPSGNNVFNLSSNLGGSLRTTALCNEAKAKKVTWEGVWDGTVCLGGQPPLP
jgi:hypothetical protein